MGRTERAIPSNEGLDGPKKPDNANHAGIASHQRNLDASNNQIREFGGYEHKIEPQVFFPSDHLGEVVLFDGTRATSINPQGVTDRPFRGHNERAGLG